MEMNKEKYEELIRRFSQELYDVGVSDDMIALLKDSIDRTPNLSSASKSELTDKFCYRHNGFLIEAKREVTIVVKKCS